MAWGKICKIYRKRRFVCNKCLSDICRHIANFLVILEKNKMSNSENHLTKKKKLTNKKTLNIIAVIKNFWKFFSKNFFWKFWMSPRRWFMSRESLKKKILRITRRRYLNKILSYSIKQICIFILAICRSQNNKNWQKNDLRFFYEILFFLDVQMFTALKNLRSKTLKKSRHFPKNTNIWKVIFFLPFIFFQNVNFFSKIQFFQISIFFSKFQFFIEIESI